MLGATSFSEQRYSLLLSPQFSNTHGFEYAITDEQKHSLKGNGDDRPVILATIPPDLAVNYQPDPKTFPPHAFLNFRYPASDIHGLQSLDDRGLEAGARLILAGSSTPNGNAAATLTSISLTVGKDKAFEAIGCFAPLLKDILKFARDELNYSGVSIGVGSDTYNMSHRPSRDTPLHTHANFDMLFVIRFFAPQVDRLTANSLTTLMVQEPKNMSSYAREILKEMRETHTLSVANNERWEKALAEEGLLIRPKPGQLVIARGDTFHRAAYMPKQRPVNGGLSSLFTVMCSPIPH